LWQEKDESFRSSDEMMEEHQELEEDGFQVRRRRNSSVGSTTEDKEQLQELHWATDHLLSPALVSGTVCHPAFVT